MLDSSGVLPYLIHVSCPHAPTVTPPQGEPFPLPPLPLSMAWQLQVLVSNFHQRTGRRLLAGLVLDPATQSWCAPLLSPQRCAAHSASWDLPPTRPADLPAPRLLAGSFTGGPATTFGQACDHFASIDGLHVYAASGPELGQCHWITALTIQGQPQRLSLAKAVYDDYHATLARYADRLTIASESH